MDPIESRQVFEQDPEMLVEEQEDGSAIIDMPEEKEAPATGHFDNLAETLDTFTLNSLSSDLLELIEKDKESRKQRDQQYREGLRRTGLGDDAPGGATFAGASRAVHPLLAEGCVDFAARTVKELLPPDGPVKIKMWGEQNRDRLEKAKSKRDYLNWLLTKKMRAYRDEKEILLTQLPLGGSQYEKYYVEGSEGAYSYAMEFVPIDKLLLPFSATSFYATPRAAHMLDLTSAEFERRVKIGFYRDIALVTETTPEGTAAEQANAKIEGKEASHYNEDGLRRLYEVRCDWALEDEDAPAPYIITVDEPTRQVVAVYRNWREDDPDRAPLDWWVEDKFIPWRGVYGIGLPHLVGELSGALTGALRALLDSAHINNSPGAVKLKGGRNNGQNITVEQTQVSELDAPPGVDDIRKIIMPLPFNPPSSVLFQLLDWITAQAKGVVATAEERIADASNQMPVGTAMALIEQGSQVFSSIHARLHESQRRGLEIICRLIHDYPNLNDLARFELTPEDFSASDDIEPVSDPRIFSEAQRYAQLQEQMKIVTAFPDLKWNREELARRGLELLRTEGVDQMLPPKPPEVTADPITENFMAVTASATLRVSPEQDHVAHLRAHLAFLLDPTFGAGPAIAGPQLQGILAHCQEHLMQVYLGAAKAAAAVKAMQTGDAGEMTMAEGSEFALQAIQKQVGNLAPMLQQASQVVQQKMPQPPVDPAVQKTFEAAMAEIERKKEVDRQNHERETTKMSVSAQAEQQQQAIDTRLAEMGNVIKFQITALQEEGKRASEELRQRVELMKNDRDNEQKQMTELIKNYQDNLTQMQIALQNVSQELSTVKESGPDFTPHIEQLNTMLASVEKAKGQDALTSVVEGLRATIEHLGRPKRTRLEFDGEGKPIGTVQE